MIRPDTEDRLPARCLEPRRTRRYPKWRWSRSCVCSLGSGDGNSGAGSLEDAYRGVW